MLELVSVHIPKTAGSSFFKILLDAYGEQLLHYSEDKKDVFGFKAIHGHFYAKEYLKNHKNSKWITWVRHPVFRLISFYNHKVYVDKINVGTFENFIEQPDLINQQAKFLDGKNLNDYFFIGIQELWEEDMIELSNLMNWPVQIVRSNFNKNPNYHEEIFQLTKNEKLMNRIIFLNQLDMELYYNALALRANRKKQNIASLYRLWYC